MIEKNKLTEGQKARLTLGRTDLPLETRLLRAIDYLGKNDGILEPAEIVGALRKYGFNDTLYAGVPMTIEIKMGQAEDYLVLPRQEALPSIPNNYTVVFSRDLAIAIVSEALLVSKGYHKI